MRSEKPLNEQPPEEQGLGESYQEEEIDIEDEFTANGEHDGSEQTDEGTQEEKSQGNPEEQSEEAAPESNEAETEAELTEVESEESDEPKVEEQQDEEDSQNESGDPVRLLEEQNLRLRAEFANYKKRIEREQMEYSEYLKGEIIRELLPIWDDFRIMIERASSAETEEGILEGAKMIYEKLQSILTKEGVTMIDALGEEFDPQLHEALMMRPIEQPENNDKVIEVFQEGFVLNKRLLRASKVVVGTYKEPEE